MRPVLLTSITAMLGLLPLVFELNVNLFTRHIVIGSVTSAWWVHLSTAMVFGLLLATVLTLIMTPVLLAAPTVFRETGPYGEGMAQLWIDLDPEADIIAMVNGDDVRLRTMAVFDAMVNNADRKGGHILPTAGGHVYGVDHGICFAAEPKLRTILWGWRGERMEERELDLLRTTQAALAGPLVSYLPRS